MNKEKKIKEYECEFCGFIPTKSQVRIERKISEDIAPCYCNIIKEISKKNKLISKLKKLNSDYFSFLMEHDDMIWAFDEWRKENSDTNEEAKK